MVRLIATDLDGTLLHHHSFIASEDVHALRFAAEHGVEVCLTSGRILPEMRQVMRRLNVRCHAVTHNGGLVYTKQDRQLSSSVFSAEVAKQIYAAGIDCGLVPLVFADDEHIYLEASTPKSRAYEDRMMIPCTYEPDLFNRLGQDIRACKVSMFGDPSKLSALQSQLGARYPNSAEAAFALEDCLDFTPYGVSKASGLTTLLSHLRVRPDELACIGDTFNDVPMFLLTPHSFAMDKGPDAVQQRASEVVSSVADAVSRLRNTGRLS